MEAALTKLPPELWCKILSYASGGDVKSLAQLAKVCGLFRGLVLTSPLPWKRVVISPGRLRAAQATPLVQFTAQHLGPWTASVSIVRYTGLTHADLLRLLTPTKGALRRLCLRCITYGKGSTAGDHFAEMEKSLDAVLALGTGLEELELSRVRAGSTRHLERVLTGAFGRLPRLRSLSLKGFRSFETTVEGEHRELALTAVSPRLRHLDLSSMFFDASKPSVQLQALAAATPALKTLLVGESALRFTVATENGGRGVAWQGLELLDISRQDGGRWTSESTQRLLLFAARSPALRELCLNNQRGALSQLVGQAMPSLRVLHANGCVAGESDGELLRQIEGQLEELHIQETRIEAALDRCFRESNATLKRLDLGFSGSSAELLARVLENCRGLEWLRTDRRSSKRHSPDVFQTPDEIAQLRSQIMMDN